MRGMKTARALSEIDYDLILEAAPERLISSNKKFPWKYAAMAASIVLVLCIGIFAVVISTKSDSTHIDTDSTSASSEWEKKYLDSSSAMDKPKSWDEMTLTEKYPTVQLSASAATGLYMTANAPIEESRLVGKLFEDVVNADAADSAAIAGSAPDGAPAHLRAQVYTIKNIDSRYAVALKFLSDSSLTDDFDCFYVYINSSADPDSFETLVNALDFSATVSFSGAYYYPDDGRTIGFEDLDKTKILDILLENAKDAKSVADPDSMLAKGSYKKRLDLATNIDIFGVRNRSISVSDDGYLVTNLLSTAKVFFIGKQTAAELIDYIISNCKGYEIVYRTNSDSSRKESSSASKDASSTASHTTDSKPDSSSVSTSTTKPAQKKKITVIPSANIGEQYPVLGKYHFAQLVYGSADVAADICTIYNSKNENITQIMNGGPDKAEQETKYIYWVQYIQGLNSDVVAISIQFKDSALDEKFNSYTLDPSVNPDESIENKDISKYAFPYFVYTQDPLSEYSCERLARAMNFTSNLDIKTADCTNANGSKARYTGFDNEKIITMLFGITSQVTADVKQVDPSKVNFKPSITMTYDFEPFSVTGEKLEISDDGYMRLKMLGHEFMYNIGKDKVEQLRLMLLTTGKQTNS